MDLLNQSRSLIWEIFNVLGDVDQLTFKHEESEAKLWCQKVFIIVFISWRVTRSRIEYEKNMIRTSEFFLTFQSGITIFDNFNLFLQAIRDQCLFFIWGQSRARSTWIIKPSNVTLKPKIYCNTLLITLKWLNIVDSAEEEIWKIENSEAPKKLYNIDHRLAGWIAEQSKRLLPRHISQL